MNKKSNKKILLCLGTRPEALKMAPVIHELKKNGFNYKVCITAQHREMLDQVLDFFSIAPDYDLNLMKPGQSLNALSALILRETDKLIRKVKPDIILVQGDTTTAFISALAAFNLGVKIGHIEAGLRTQNLKGPFPEEGNRQLISRITNFHLVPTALNRENLLKEGVDKQKIKITGNTIIDALLFAKEKLNGGHENTEIKELKTLIQGDKKLILVTGHRRENLGKGLEDVCQGLLKLAEREDVLIIFPVHLNPRVKEPIYRLLGSISNIYVISPVSYPAFIWLMMQADLIISDSGGIQEEAPSLKKPVIVTRENTERTEALEAGFSFLAGTSRKKIINLTEKILKSPPDYSRLENPYGDGLASKKIVEILKEIYV